MYKLIENIKLALKAVWAKKIRSILTMLGVIIGVFAIVILIGIGEGLKNEVKKEIESIGSNLLFVLPGKIDSGSLPTGMVGTSSITKDDIEEIEQQQYVDAVTPIMIMSQPVSRGERVAPGALSFGTTANIEENFLKGATTDIKEGRSMTEEDYRSAARVAIIMGKVKQDLFGDGDPIGEEIKIGSENFEVIGWREARESGSIFSGPEYSQVVIIPLTAAEELVGSEEIHRIIVSVSDSDFVESEKKAIEELMLENHNGVEDFSVLTQDDFLDLIGSILSLITNMLAGIAAISLIVGGIGVMNIMLVSVTERTREIGLRKAIGASNVDILVQFLVESVFLTFLGGAIGITLAFIGSAIMKAKLGLAPLINLESVLMAFGFIVLVGVFFGLAPAIRAARLNPIDALKYE